MSAPIGSGHALAAQALGEAFREQGNCEITQGSAFDFFPQILGTTFVKSYLFILQHIPFIYKIAYKWGNSGSSSFWLRDFINKMLARLAENYLNKVKPDVVIATHATPAGILSWYNVLHKSNILLASVITDFTIHKWWLCQGTDLYFLAADNLEPQLVAEAEQKVYITGIPVRASYNKPFDKKTLRAKLHWAEEKKVCLLMGGGDGLLPMFELIKSIHQVCRQEVKFVAVTGRNKDLAQKLKHLAVDIDVYGFTDIVPELMNAADCIVSKAGGLTGAETLTTNLHYIIYNPIPGQEAANAEFLRKNGAAEVAYTAAEVGALIQKFLVNPQITESNQGLGKPNAANEIVRTILDELNRRRELDR